MHKDESPQWSVVVALPEPIAVGTTFERRQWPAHVTLASNFVFDGPRTALEHVVRELCANESALMLRFTRRALFGPSHDIPVQLVEPDHVVAVHERLTDLLENLPGFAPDQPAFWRGGYCPHMTHVPGITILEGASHQLTSRLLT